MRAPSRISAPLIRTTGNGSSSGDAPSGDSRPASCAGPSSSHLGADAGMSRPCGRSGSGSGSGSGAGVGSGSGVGSGVGSGSAPASAAGGTGPNSFERSHLPASPCSFVPRARTASRRPASAAHHQVRRPGGGLIRSHSALPSPRSASTRRRSCPRPRRRRLLAWSVAPNTGSPVITGGSTVGRRNGRRGQCGEPREHRDRHCCDPSEHESPSWRASPRARHYATAPGTSLSFVK